MAKEASPTERQLRWKQNIKDWVSSGQSQKAYCDCHHLDYHQFGYWRRKFSEHGRQNNRPPSSGFAAVSHQRQISSTGSGLSLNLPNGLVLQGIAANNVEVAYQLIRRLS